MNSSFVTSSRNNTTFELFVEAFVPSISTKFPFFIIAVPSVCLPVQHDILQSPDSLLTSSTHQMSSHIHPTVLSPMNTSLRMSCPPLPLQSPPPHLLSLHSDAAEKTAPYTVTQKVKNGQATPNQSQPQVEQNTSAFY